MGQRRVAKWAAENPGVALTLCGLVTFGYLRLAYLFFYNPLGVSPDEVGLGYQETLVGAVTLLLSLAVFALSFVLVGLVLGVGRVALAAGRRAVASSDDEAAAEDERADEEEAATEEKTAAEEQTAADKQSAADEQAADARAKVRGSVRRAVDGVGGFLFSLLLLHLYLAHFEGNVARAGKESGITILGIQLFQARAEFASVTPASSEPLSAAVSGRSCLLYLGQSAGTTVLYDATKRQAIRLPTSTLALTTYEHRPSACVTKPTRKQQQPELRPGPEPKKSP